MGMDVTEIPLERIRPNKLNPRQGIDEQGLDELAKSIASVGVMQPITVRPTADGYEVVVGERRFRASKLAGLDKIPAIVRELTDAEVLELILIENAQREDLNDVEKGNSCSQLLERYPKEYPDVAALAKKLAVSSSSVKNWIAVSTSVPREIQRMIATQEKRGAPIPKGSITSQVALQITRSVKEPKRQVEVARAFAERAIPVHKARKVMKEVVKETDRSVQEVVTEVLEAPPELPFRLDHAKIILAGKKTQTSRFMRQDEIANLRAGSVVVANIWEPRFAELEVTAVLTKKLVQFTEEDAKREGGYTLSQFREVWKSIHGPDAWSPGKEVTVIQFKLKHGDGGIKQILLPR